MSQILGNGDTILARLKRMTHAMKDRSCVANSFFPLEGDRQWQNSDSVLGKQEGIIP